jgi:hypothetical protein
MQMDENKSTTNEGDTGQLEALLSRLHGQIKTSDWLSVNTADKLQSENPELLRAWQQAVAGNAISNRNNTDLTAEEKKPV